MALNHDNVLMSGGDNGSLYFWDYKTGMLRAAFVYACRHLESYNNILTKCARSKRQDTTSSGFRRACSQARWIAKLAFSPLPLITRAAASSRKSLVVLDSR